jgi:hypothetical protein
MPQVTVYIRERDLEKWKAIEKKSEFIHKALNFEYGTPTKVSTFNTPSHIPKVSTSNIESNRTKPVVCKHGYSPSLCKFAKKGKC